ncbi:hypothetical protein BDZ89DRAFT_474696 [Hymenopellis radicata]|nr:hypothetical protein BDZ89DRAFT_474696 [Hymenopellis radicata]
MGTPREVYASVVSLNTTEINSLYLISLPHLTDLNVVLVVDQVDFTILPSIISLLRHSRCRLSTLSLGHGGLDYIPQPGKVCGKLYRGNPGFTY